MLQYSRIPKERPPLPRDINHGHDCALSNEFALLSRVSPSRLLTFFFFFFYMRARQLFFFPSRAQGCIKEGHSALRISGPIRTRHDPGRLKLSKNFEAGHLTRASDLREYPTNCELQPIPLNNKQWLSRVGLRRAAALASCDQPPLLDPPHKCSERHAQRDGTTQQRPPPQTPRLPTLSTRSAS